MAIRVSSWLRTAMMTNYGMERMMRYGHIRVFTGKQPESADMAETGDLIGIISTDGKIPSTTGADAGLMMEPGERPGMLVNRDGWMLRGVGDGHAGWWRFVAYAPLDEGGVASSLSRIDGSVGESLVLPDNYITTSTLEPIDGFFMYLP